MLIRAYAYFILDAIHLTATLIEEDEATGLRSATKTLTTTVPSAMPTGRSWELAEELGRLLQEWSWTERGL